MQCAPSADHLDLIITKFISSRRVNTAQVKTLRLSRNAATTAAEMKWLTSLKRFDSEVLHPKSKALLGEFISLSSSARAYGDAGDFLLARKRQVILLRVQADLIVSLPSESGLKAFISKQFAVRWERIDGLLCLLCEVAFLPFLA